MSKLSSNFINEFFRLCFLKKDIYEICKNHIKYQYLPDDLRAYKKILKSIINTNSGSLPSFGVISQQYSGDMEVQEAISAIKDSDIVDKEQIIDQLEIFIKNQRFKVLNDKVVEMYMATGQDRKDEAIKLMASESDGIVNFSLKNNVSSFLRVFADFSEQNRQRQEVDHHDEGHGAVPFGIDMLDDITNGGIDVTDTALWIMRSGVGKSTVLRWTGMYACRMGYDVLHIQLEGSKEEAFDKYSQIWTKGKYSDIKYGNFSSAELEKIGRYIKKMESSNKELFIYSFDKFGEASMVDVRDLVIDFFRINGKYPGLIIIDSLDLVSTGINAKLDNDPNWKKEKMDKVAQLMKDIATEFRTRVLTTTQSSDFPGWDDPDQYLTRSNTEGNRTLVKPFSFVFTFNVTREEHRANIGRVFIDKFRNYKIKKDLFKIKTLYDGGSFYDRAGTIKMYDRVDNI